VIFLLTFFGSVILIRKTTK